MDIEEFTENTFRALKINGFNFVIGLSISGIISEGDDVKNLFVPFRTFEEAQKFGDENGTAYPINLLDAENEVHEAFQAISEIKFFIEKKYLTTK